jgi:Patatin-like phospholipase
MSHRISYFICSSCMLLSMIGLQFVQPRAFLQFLFTVFGHVCASAHYPLCEGRQTYIPCRRSLHRGRCGAALYVIPTVRRPLNVPAVASKPGLWMRAGQPVSPPFALHPDYPVSASNIKHSPRILSLDGRGVRGLSALLILREMMDDIGRQSDASETPKLSEYFDLIGGTSTGGLIAIMLGLLGMVSRQRGQS